MRQFLSTVPCSLFPVPDNCREVYYKLGTGDQGFDARVQAGDQFKF
ncbi:MAG: hypothetical protein F6K55_22375 [Moorea sp. SIO4A3]|nr:hypothetical protein [Moorena sp. SIO4A3]